MTILFLQHKDICGVQGLIVTQDMAVAIATQACLPILKLGLGSYDDWVEMVVYPGAFRVVRDTRNEFGLISHEDRALSGECWSGGRLILSWDQVASELAGSVPGRNVVVHECAHKLDMLDGSANGIPPLHRGMVKEDWTQALSEGFARVQQQLQDDLPPDMDPYGATAPEEFFAVASESFFCAPQQLKQKFPMIYQQMVLFYRQDPGLRQARPREFRPDGR